MSTELTPNVKTFRICKHFKIALLPLTKLIVSFALSFTIVSSNYPRFLFSHCIVLVNYTLSASERPCRDYFSIVLEFSHHQFTLTGIALQISHI